LLVVLVCSNPIPASEPYLFVRILPEWDETGEILHLEISPDQNLGNVSFRLDVPEILTLEPVEGPYRDLFHEWQELEGFRTLMADLGDLNSRSVLTLSFSPSNHHSRGGVVSITLMGETGKGVPVRESIGVAVGHPGDRPVSRNGALEYPAVSLPQEP
jgi:hypothetical protein